LAPGEHAGAGVDAPSVGIGDDALAADASADAEATGEPGAPGEVEDASAVADVSVEDEFSA
jgi:hypothetical protein